MCWFELPLHKCLFWLRWVSSFPVEAKHYPIDPPYLELFVSHSVSLRPSFTQTVISFTPFMSLVIMTEWKRRGADQLLHLQLSVRSEFASCGSQVWVPFEVEVPCLLRSSTAFHPFPSPFCSCFPLPLLCVSNAPIESIRLEEVFPLPLAPCQTHSPSPIRSRHFA